MLFLVALLSMPAEARRCGAQSQGSSLPACQLKQEGLCPGHSASMPEPTSVQPTGLVEVPSQPAGRVERAELRAEG